jgi:hypothetical protein
VTDPTRSCRLLALLLAIPLMLPLTACEEDVFVPPDPPEEEINDVNAYLFRNWDTDEPDVLETGLAALIELLDEFDLDAEYRDRCYKPDPLTEEDLTDVPHPDRDPSDVNPVALVMASAFLPVDQATDVIIMPDQRPVEPHSPEHYERSFVDPTDPSCFPGGDCRKLITDNDIIKDYLVISMHYEMPKAFRWVEIGETGSGEWAILARCWQEDSYETDGGAVQLNQSYCIDVHFPRESGGARYMVTWPETVIEGVEDDLIYETTIMGMNDILVTTEEYLASL